MKDIVDDSSLSGVGTIHGVNVLKAESGKRLEKSKLLSGMTYLKNTCISVHFPMIVLIFIILFFLFVSVKVRGPEINVHK